MKHTAAKIVPKLLNFEQIKIYIKDLLKKVIIGNESWMYGYDIETKAQSSRFTTVEEIKEKLKQELLAIPKSMKKKCFKIGKKTLTKVYYS